MTNITKLLFYTIMAFIFISAPAVAEEEKSNNGKMRSVSWNTPKPKEKVIEEKVEEAKEEEEEEEIETELTPEEKLWKKYQDLAYGNNEITPDETDIVEENEVVAEESDAKSPMGIASIIEGYKKSQENKGKMNSRSFGKID